MGAGIWLLILVLLAFAGSAYWSERRRRPTGTPAPGYRGEINLPHEAEWEVYHNPLSLCSKKLRFCMDELGLAYTGHEVELIETGAYENIRPAFLQVNPGGTVPVLVHQGHPIYESHEQIVYAAQHAGEMGQRLLGASPEGRAAVSQWVDFGALKGNPLEGGPDRAGDSVPALTFPLFAAMVASIPWVRIAEGLLFHFDRRRPLLFMMLKLRGLNGLPPPMLKIVANAGTYRIKKCSANDENMARISHGLIHGGMITREMSSDSALHALNISITTSTVKESVIALTLPVVK